MHRWLVILSCLLLLIELPALAQDDEEEPLPPPRHAQPKIGGAGGFTQNLLFMDLDPINQVLSSSKAAPFDKGPILLLGGQGYAYILVVQNLRVGGLGAGGSITSKELDQTTNITRTVQLSVSYAGVSVDYVIPIVPRLDLAVGVVLGRGGTTFKMTTDQGNGKVWDNLWSAYGNGTPASEYTRTLSGSFFVYQPSVSVEYSLLRWLGLRLGASYLGMAGGSWNLDDNYDVANVPSNISGKGFMINGGIFVGTFLF